jgi:hypothetical protein
VLLKAATMLVLQPRGISLQDVPCLLLLQLLLQQPLS